MEHQALQIFSADGDYRYLEPEKNISKFRVHMPAYADLLEKLAALEGHGETNFLDFITPYFEIYGQGEISLTLMLLLARRYYGDSLRFKRETNTLMDIQFTNADEMLALVQV